jgi:hypothetical protein
MLNCMSSKCKSIIEAPIPDAVRFGADSLVVV